MTVSGYKSIRMPHFWVSQLASATAGNFTAVRGAFVGATIGGGERGTGERHVADSDVPLIGVGKRAGQTVTVNYVYAEGDTAAGGLFSIAKHAYEATNPVLCLRWTISSSTASGAFVFATDTGGYGSYIISPPYIIPGDVNDAAPAMGSFTVFTKKIVQSTF